MHTETPFGLALVDSARLLRARFDRALTTAELGLTPGEARALIYANRHPGSRQTVLAAAMGVEPMTLVGFLDRLEAMELIAREPDPADRRAKLVCLTPKAEPLLAHVLEVFTAAREEMLVDFTAEEIDQFWSLLVRLRAKLLADERGETP